MTAPLSADPPRKQARIRELDGLRAVCVALVIVSHLAAYSKTIPVPPSWIWLTGYGGSAGVRIFFTISGFIITRLTLDELISTGSFSVRRFFIKRFFRIIPAYWVYLAAATGAASAGLIHANIGNLLFCLTFTTDIFTLKPVFFYGHSWSLSVEEQYYAVFPLVVLLFAKRGLRALTVVLGAFFILAAGSLHLRESLSPDSLHPARLLHIDAGFLANFRYIVAGVLLAFWWARLGTFLDRVHGLWMTGVLALLAGMAYAADPGGSIYVGKYSQLLGEPLLLAVLVGWIVRHPAHLGLLRAVPMQWVGKCSYSVYLWQQLFCAGPGDYGAGRAPWLIASIALTLLCAGLSYYFIERPFNAWGRTFLRKGNAPANRTDAALAVPQA